jgi:hypothetical protein
MLAMSPDCPAEDGDGGGKELEVRLPRYSSKRGPISILHTAPNRLHAVSREPLCEHRSELCIYPLNFNRRNDER